jgi:hypothetical protein
VVRLNLFLSRHDAENVMTTSDPAVFHKLYGIKQPKVTYYGKDFIDYTVMIALSALVVGFSYGFGHFMSIVGFALCAFALATFVIRHGIELRVPLIVRMPQEVLYMFIYKLQNLKPIYFIALGLLLLENFAIARTPNLPHHVELMRKIALYLFYIHFLSITAYRTAVLVGHLVKKELVREVLRETPWRRVVNAKTNITMEIAHAYSTGVLTHVILIAPWYLVIVYSRFSVILLPVVCVLNVMIHRQWLKVFNAWFYRDHWLGHNSEFEFVFLHGTHHDAIPSGLIAVAENGFLEGFMRFTLGSPIAFYNPVVACLLYTFEIKNDIERHQYIPGVFPRLPKSFMEIFQHSTHHYGLLAPYSIGMKLDQPGVSEADKKAWGWLPDEVTNSIKLDEELTGFQWNNPTQKRTLSLYEKYQNDGATGIERADGNAGADEEGLLRKGR